MVCYGIFWSSQFVYLALSGSIQVVLPQWPTGGDKPLCILTLPYQSGKIKVQAVND